MSHVRHYTRFFALSLILCALTLLAQPAVAEVRNVAAAEAAALLAAPPAGLTVLDVRTPQEFAAGHVAGARNVDFFGPSFEKQLLSMDRSSPYLVYCRSGNRSGGALEIMQKLGFSHIIHMRHGINEWNMAGLPLVKP